MTHSFLFASWDGGGNLPPLLTLARRLRDRGHSVRVLGDDASANDVRASGIDFLPWQKAPNRRDRSPEHDPMRDWEIRSPDALLPMLLDKMICGPALAQARDVMDVLQDSPADVVISSDLTFGPLVGAEAAGIRSAVLACNVPYLPIADVPPFGPGFLPPKTAEEAAAHDAVRREVAAGLDLALPALNRARTELGLEPLAHLLDQLDRAALHLVATAEAFDYPSSARPKNMRYVGPLLDLPPWAGDWQAAARERPRPLVLVAFSTTFQDQGPVLQRVIDALARLDVDAIVTTGPIGANFSLHSAPNVRIVDRAPHDAILREAALLITHAGHGTVMRGLTAGVPLLCLPMGRDQNDNAARVIWHGAGLSLPPTSPAADIEAAVSALLADSSFAAASARLGQAIGKETEPDRAADLLEALASAVRDVRMAAA